jgi:hypothetical protein
LSNQYSIGTATTLGITIPLPVSGRADEVIEQTFLLQCMSPLLAQSGHADTLNRCPLLGVKRTWLEPAAMSAFDPKRTSALLPFRTAL